MKDGNFMLDRRMRELLGKALVILVGPAFLIVSLLVINTSAAVATTGETIMSYLSFMVAFAAFAGGAFLWVRARHS
jgi:hypothetical protein